MKVKTTLLLILPALLLSSCQGHGTPLSKTEAARQFELLEDKIEHEVETLRQFTLHNDYKRSSGGAFSDTKTTFILDLDNSYLHSKSKITAEINGVTSNTEEDIYLYKENDKYIFAHSISAQGESVNDVRKYYYKISEGSSTFIDIVDYVNLNAEVLKEMVDETIDFIEESFEYINTSTFNLDASYYSKGEGHFYMSLNTVENTDNIIYDTKGYFEFSDYFLSSGELNSNCYTEENGKKVDLFSLESSVKVSKTAELTYPNLSEYNYTVS